MPIHYYQKKDLWCNWCYGKSKDMDYCQELLYVITDFILDLVQLFQIQQNSEDGAGRRIFVLITKIANKQANPNQLVPITRGNFAVFCLWGNYPENYRIFVWPCPTSLGLFWNTQSFRFISARGCAPHRVIRPIVAGWSPTTQSTMDPSLVKAIS